VRKMIGNLVLTQNNEGIALGMKHPVLGFLPVLVFADWSRFKEFIDSMTEYYDMYYPKVPEVFILAFQEEEEDKC